MDCICIKGLEVFARHGVLPEENVLGQKFVISVNMNLSVRKAGQTDDLEKSVNYAQVASFIKKQTEDKTFQLIERLAEYLAEEILLEFSLVEKVDVTVEKPWAPVLLPLDTVSVSITRKWHDVYLSIGSNMGDREAHLNQAVDRIRQDRESRVEQVSGYIETAPVGGVEQEDFLNGALWVKTLRTPEEFLELIGDIEQEQKRERLVHWGPRTIDVDILLYDQELIHSKELTVPHIEMCNRLFVLDPMVEIAPYVCHPANGKTMLQLQEECKKRQ